MVERGKTLILLSLGYPILVLPVIFFVAAAVNILPLLFVFVAAWPLVHLGICIAGLWSVYRAHTRKEPVLLAVCAVLLNVALLVLMFVLLHMLVGYMPDEWVASYHVILARFAL